MLYRALDYFPRFHCLAGACPHTCCAGWEVTVDGASARRYSEEPGPLGEELRSVLRRDREDFRFALRGERCPFLDGKNLCALHRALGETATPETCREHPRFTEDYGPFREVTLSASCPAANELLLGEAAPLEVITWETPEAAEDGDSWLDGLVPLRDRLLARLTDRARPLRRRLADFLELSADAQLLLDEGRTGDLTVLLDNWRPWEGENREKEGVFPFLLRFLRTLEPLDGDWRAVLARAEAAAPCPQPPERLERVAVYFAFRYPLKAVNDADLLGRSALCVLAVLAVERIAAVTGLPEAVRRFSREVEHDGENVDALLAALGGWEELSLPHFLRELEIHPPKRF